MESAALYNKIIKYSLIRESPMSGQQGNNKECEKVVYFKRPPDLEHSFT